MTEQDFFKLIAGEEGIQVEQVKATAALLDDENTVPFIARYRKEVTGGLDETKIIATQDRMRYLRMLEERKQTVLKSIADQGKLTDELRDKIEAALKLQEVEDLYLPYKPKKRTRATVAKEKGLEPLAQRMWEQQDVEGNPEEIAAAFINEEKGVKDAREALAGACDIIAEWVSDDAEVRKQVRAATWEKGSLHSEARDPENLDVYEIYKDYRDVLKKVLPHRTLAINRGEKEGYLRIQVEAPIPEILAELEHKFIREAACIFVEHLRATVKDAYERLIAPAIERELRNDLTDGADQHAIEVFAANLRNLLMQPPTKGHIIMGIDPGFRTGCKVAVIDQTGKYLEGDTIYPHEPKKRWDHSKQQLHTMIKEHNVSIIAIGNGTASRETEQLVAEVIQEAQAANGQEAQVANDRETQTASEQETQAANDGAVQMLGVQEANAVLTRRDQQINLRYAIVNEAGASVYSASELARQELPDLEASLRGNVSIARRLLDPLSELVKIDPKSIGVGLYQHDVNQGHLAESLDRVVESCVNNVGVNLNTASPALLRYVAGITRSTADSIVRYRDENGQFKSRKQLMDVKGLGPKAFTQCGGFLRIPDADMFFDSTAVHPESYEAAERFLGLIDMSVDAIRARQNSIREKMKAIQKSIDEIAGECGIGVPTLEDIIASLEKPERDPRDEAPRPIFRQDVLKIEDLKEGMVLKGTVRNVVDFGAFVDIGVKQDGLVHLSQMSYKYIKSPLEVAGVGDVVDVRVLRVEAEKGRIALSMLLEGERKPAEKSQRQPRSEAKTVDGKVTDGKAPHERHRHRGGRRHRPERQHDEHSARPHDEQSPRPQDEHSQRSQDEHSKRSQDERSKRSHDERSRRPHSERKPRHEKPVAQEKEAEAFAASLEKLKNKYQTRG